MIESKLTHHLLSLCPHDAVRATTAHPFIAAVGRGTIPRAHLEAWLAQDRHYLLQGYLPFMGSMLSRVPLPSTSTPSQQTGAGALGPRSEESRRYFHTVQVLSGAIANAVREAAFFEKTAEEAGFDLSVGAPRDVAAGQGAGADASAGTGAKASQASYPIGAETEAYLHYMSRLAHTGTFLEQLTFLWAMEILYYRAWSQAASFRAKTAPTSSSSTAPSSATTSSDPTTNGKPAAPTTAAAAAFTEAESAAIAALINNWSSAEFATFVEELGDLLDAYAGQGDIARLAPEVLARLQDVWRHTVGLERAFWYAGRGEWAA